MNREDLVNWASSPQYITLDELRHLVTLGLLSKLEGAMLEIAYGIKSGRRGGRPYTKRCSKVADEWGVDPSDLRKKLKRHGIVKSGKNGERARPWVIRYPKAKGGENTPAIPSPVAGQNSPAKQGTNDLLDKGATPCLTGEKTPAPQGLLSEICIEELISFTGKEAPSGRTDQNGINPPSSIQSQVKDKTCGEVESHKEEHPHKRGERSETWGVASSPIAAAPPSPKSDYEKRLAIVRSLFTGVPRMELWSLWNELVRTFEREEAFEEKDLITDTMVCQDITRRYIGPNLVEDTIQYFAERVAPKPPAFKPWISPFRDSLAKSGKLKAAAPKVRPPKKYSVIPPGERIPDEP
jgi:hypothetical protein